ncbi:unnamed protein product [Linum tenue]|uniref:Uncharacterized protein n=1 Tax=Linum tenue TaxID=586396 RepID=A0AAV0ITW7_9ROSI|nr:unnamed protein product [Linum tenue]
MAMVAGIPSLNVLG